MGTPRPSTPRRPHPAVLALAGVFTLAVLLGLALTARALMFAYGHWGLAVFAVTLAVATTLAVAYLRRAARRAAASRNR